MTKIAEKLSNLFAVHSLGKAFLLRVLLFSSIISLLLTVLQILMEYHDGTRTLERGIDQIQSTIQDSLTNSIWMINEEQINLQLKGLSQYPSVSEVKLITDSQEEYYLAGNYSSTHSLVKESDLFFNDSGTQRQLGTLTITLSLQPLFNTLRERIALILLSNALKTFLVSLFILSLYRRLIGKHLEEIASYTHSLDIDHLDTPLFLERRALPKDEIASIASAINKMREQLQTDFQILEDERRALLESESRIETVSANLPGFIFQLRGDHQHVDVTFLSEGLYRHFGIDPVPVRQDFTKLAASFEPGQWKMILDDSTKELIANGKYIEDTPIHARDQKKWVRIIVNGEKTSVGDYIFNGLVIDITPQKELELHRLAMEQRVANQQKMEALGTLSSGIAHNFNNIIQGLSNTLFLLKKERPGDQRQIILERGESFLNQGKSLVENILSYGRQEESQGETYSLPEVVRETVELFKSSISKHYAVKVNILDEKIEIKGNRNLLAQAILNLLINSSQALESTTGEIEVEVRKNNVDVAYLIVRDNGQGIKEQSLARIFDPFYTTKPLGVGTGLGLYFVYNVIQEHKGKINVTSSPGTKTSFTLELPLCSHERISKDKKSSGHKEICLVDDHEALTEMLKEALERKNCTVHSFNDPMLALKSIAKHSYDFVISDQNMPGMIGNEFALKVKEAGFGGSFVLISGNPLVSEDDRDTIQATLRKPFKLQELMELLDSLAQK